MDKKSFNVKKVSTGKKGSRRSFYQRGKRDMITAVYRVNFATMSRGKRPFVVANVGVM